MATRQRQRADKLLLALCPDQQTWSYSTLGDIVEVKYREDMDDGVVLLLDSES